MNEINLLIRINTSLEYTCEPNYNYKNNRKNAKILSN